MFSIRVKVTAITIIAILISMLSVVVVCYVTIQQENDVNSVEMMNLVGQNTQQSVDETLESIEQSVETAAYLAADLLDTAELVEDGAAKSAHGEKKQTPAQVERLDKYVGQYSDDLQMGFASIASYTQDVVAYYFCINPEFCPTQHGFYYTRAGKAGFGQREPLNALEMEPDDPEYSMWYYTPIQRGRPSWVGPYTASSLDGMDICSYVVPIFKTGTLIGVLGMDLPMERLTEQISNIRIYDTGFAALLDPEGRILYHPDLEPGSVPEITGHSDLNDILQQENSGKELLLYSINGQERQMYFSTLSNGMKLVITAPEDEITASWTRLTRIITIVAAVIIFVFGLIVLIAMGIITRPLKRLTAASQQLADGDYDVELKYESRDEVGTLTRAFNQMRIHIKEYIEDLNRRIHTDALTGMPNMRYFFQLAKAERQRLRENGETPYFLYFNLIGMRDFNRRYGFKAGDQLICEVAEILSRHYGDECRSRFGRDHFVTITDGSRLEEELQEIFKEMQGANEGKTLPIQVGIYMDSMEDVDVNEACDRAKFACDQQSGTYVSGYRYFDEDMLMQTRYNRYFTSHLDRALEEGWIQVYYQPIIRAENGKICDEEALSRWVDPKRGLMSPKDFIPVLESARLIYKLDLYVLDEILKKMKQQERDGLPVVPHSLNLSREDFDSCDIVEEVRRRVDEAGIPRDKLHVEVTESIVGGDFEFMKEQVQRFQDLGFHVWMDDFGSGYSALDVLQDIHFDLIKFDMWFVHRFEEGEESKIILTELLKMASELGLDTIVEGVETEEQVEFLKKVGASKLQGYYFSKPVPLEEIEKRCREEGQLEYEEQEEEELR